MTFEWTLMIALGFTTCFSIYMMAAYANVVDENRNIKRDHKRLNEMYLLTIGPRTLTEATLKNMLQIMLPVGTSLDYDRGYSESVKPGVIRVSVVTNPLTPTSRRG